MKTSRDQVSRLFFVCITLISLMLPVSAAELPKADRVLVEKAKRSLTLFREGKVLKIFQVALGPNATGHKEKEGDGKTPEGIYRIDWRNPQSKYHRSLHISYPNGDDLARAAKLGLSPGGDIMIHGSPNGSAAPPAGDWTIGCIAVTDAEIEEIWNSVDDGTQIEIRP